MAKHNSFSGELVVKEFMLVLVMAKFLEDNEIAMLVEVVMVELNSIRYELFNQVLELCCVAMVDEEKVKVFTVMAKHNSCT